MTSFSTKLAWWSGGGGGHLTVPTRAEVCSVRMTFQGLTITTNQFGTQPWFEPAYQCLTSPYDRASVRRQKKMAGDTHLILEFFTNEESIYNEAGQPWQAAITPSMEQNQSLFRQLVEEIVQDGLIPLVVFDGDDADNPMGYPNAIRQLPILVNLLQGLHEFILYGRLWDGVFYGSSPEHIANFGTQFRTLLPDGYLAIEHQPGKIPVGNGPADWMNGGAMTTYDVLMHELQDGNIHQDSTWQVAGRVLGPNYHRPADQPQGDDPDPPWYFVQGTPRGPYVAVAFEYYEYEWVRGLVTPDRINQDRNYLKSIGYTCVC